MIDAMAGAVALSQAQINRKPMKAKKPNMKSFM